ncbi:hypothetical protein HETIRDRAFT_148919 [Heterobasidion irregulare TC 32-1]|uniref:Uncharacterized protein n=1 Tax=Heterobasidion irregulare (strain TC 32-1) TaxID=747525 RepID=W4JNW8_HETIT|nr:uncharacterized protein HETIRDRAFT_148919 [Heterobasidion irregulare TC 32-1]ETW75252.1 hypothetical protein HETIRDRAFT_148919 [Heterobasidion irregulare TC 32-1]
MFSLALSPLRRIPRVSVYTFRPHRHYRYPLILVHLALASIDSSHRMQGFFHVLHWACAGSRILFFSYAYT